MDSQKQFKQFSKDPSVLKAVTTCQELYRKRQQLIEKRLNVSIELLQIVQYLRENECSQSILLFERLKSLIMEDTWIEYRLESKKYSMQNYVYNDDYTNHNMPPIDFPLTPYGFNKILTCVCDKYYNILPAYCVHNVLHDAAENLKMKPNINIVQIPKSKSITICGPLNGSLKDLIKIFHSNGLPTSNNPYLFNGDFSANGPKSIEVLILILAAYLAYPGSVFLNRGNHEDYIMSECFGFSRRLKTIYPNLYNKIDYWLDEFFRHLPLATIINKSVFVVHGGVTSTLEVQNIDKLERSKFKSMLSPNDMSKEIEDDWKLILSIVWSNHNVNGTMSNEKGRLVGEFFDLNDILDFLKRHNFRYIISSNTVVVDGIEHLCYGKLIVLNSVTDLYGPNTNSGGFLKLYGNMRLDSHIIWPRPIDSNKAKLQIIKAIEAAALIELMVFLFEKSFELEQTLLKYDNNRTGVIKLFEWCESLKQLTNLNIDWSKYYDILTNTNNKLIKTPKFKIQYSRTIDFVQAPEVISRYANSTYQKDLIFINTKSLEKIFANFSNNATGYLSYKSFCLICMILGHFLPDDSVLKLKRIFKIFDKTRNGYLCIEEFLIVFEFYEKFHRTKIRFSLMHL